VYPCFDVVVGPVWSHDPDSYAGCTAATARTSSARQVKGDDSDAKGYPGTPGWGFGVGFQTHPVRLCCFEKLRSTNDSNARRSRRKRRKKVISGRLLILNLPIMSKHSSGALL